MCSHLARVQESNIISSSEASSRVLYFILYLFSVVPNLGGHKFAREVFRHVHDIGRAQKQWITSVFESVLVILFGPYWLTAYQLS